MLWFEPGQLLIFLVAASILAVTPGPGVTYVLARTVAGGRGEGVASSFGTAVGGLVHVVAAALGLSAILARSAIAFSLVKYIGACYLVYTGNPHAARGRWKRARPLASAGGRAAGISRGHRHRGPQRQDRALLRGVHSSVRQPDRARDGPVRPARSRMCGAQYRGRCDRRSGCISPSRRVVAAGGFVMADGSRWALDARSSGSARMWRSQQASADQVILFPPTAGRTGLRSLLATVGLTGRRQTNGLGGEPCLRAAPRLRCWSSSSTSPVSRARASASATSSWPMESTPTTSRSAHRCRPPAGVSSSFWATAS